LGTKALKNLVSGHSSGFVQSPVLKEVPAYAAEKPGFLPSKAEDTFFARFLVS